MSQILHTDLSTPIYERIKKMILENDLVPGQKIIQEKIATELGVSRTPLRQALQRLEYEFLVESVPRRGMFVKKVGPKEVIDIFDCREGLELVALRLVIKHINEEELEILRNIFKPFTRQKTIDSKKYAEADVLFHKKLIEFSRNEVLNRLFFHGDIHAKIAMIGLVRPPEETISEHIELLVAIEQKNVKAATEILSRHIRTSRDFISASLQRTSS